MGHTFTCPLRGVCDWMIFSSYFPLFFCIDRRHSLQKFGDMVYTFFIVILSEAIAKHPQWRKDLGMHTFFVYRKT